MALRAVQDELGCRVCVCTLQSRPELNRLAGTIVSVDESRGRLGVRVDGHSHGHSDPISLARERLMREDKPFWDNCRHGGPDPEPAMMQQLRALVTHAMSLTAPCLEHVRLLEPYVRQYAPPAILLASMGVDAFLSDPPDFKNCRSFAVYASVLDGVHNQGLDRFFASVAARVSGGPASPAVATLEARLAKCSSAAGLSEVLSGFIACPMQTACGEEWSCLQIAAHRGVGLKQSDIDPAPSPVDAVWEGRERRPPRSASAAAAQAGERIGRLALQQLEAGAAGDGHQRALAVRATADELVRRTAGSSRGESREQMLEAFEACAVAGAIFVEAGGVEQLEAVLDRCLVDSPQGGPHLRKDTKLGEEALLAFEIIEKLQSAPLASALIRGGAASRICHFLAPPGHDLVLDHRAVTAVCSILSTAEPSEFTSALGCAALKPVVSTLGAIMFDMLSEDILDFRQLDVLLNAATVIAGSNAELARLVATTTARGISHCIPTSLLLILCQHAHEQQAGRTDGPNPHGSGLVHIQPICMALEGLYTISLHFDLRVVNTSDDGFVDALGEYASFLHGFVHYQANASIAQACLARLIQFTHTSAPPMDPRPPPVETESEQSRRLVQYVHSLQEARRRVREQRLEQRTRGVGLAVERANESRQRGNELIRAGSWQAAAVAYSEAVMGLTGFEMANDTAWSLLLALSNRAEAFLKLARYEEVLEDCTNAWVLLERHEGGFDAERAASIGEKLTRREAASTEAIEAQQRGAARAEAGPRSAAERGQARADRRWRAREVRRRAREQAEREAEAQVQEQAELVEATAALDVQDDDECHICLEGSDEGPLEDVCGHGHLLHPGCAAIWRDRCLEQQRLAPGAGHPGPHCPACRRAV